MATVYLGIGSNIGNKEANCEEAVCRLSEIAGIQVMARSEFYPTKPAGDIPQEDFLNGAVKIDTALLPEDCLRMFKDIEKDMGRKESGRNHPRIVDIDILLYDDMILRRDNLTIPHPRMHERYFVLRGLAEIAPETVHPVFGKMIKELFASVIGVEACRLSQLLMR